MEGPGGIDRVGIMNDPDSLVRGEVESEQTGRLKGKVWRDLCVGERVMHSMVEVRHES